MSDGAATAIEVRTAVLVTHAHPEELGEPIAAAREAAKGVSCELVPEKEAGPEPPDLCLVLGGDGSILYALRRYAGAGVPVFGVNFGTIGFLAAVDRDQLDEGLRRAFSGDFEIRPLPALEATLPDGPRIALNDISLHRRPHGRVAELSYSVGGEEVGHVRCDGVVAATPAGSTGYNLANQGPILAWGVEGFVVSFIAPHTLTARALVVAPDDRLEVVNAGAREPVEIAIDGEMSGELAPGAALEIGFRDGVGSLAQVPGASFYRRIREKFGRLAG